MGKIAAFFDIDGTLYRDSLMVEHFKKLIKYDIIDQKAWFEHARDTFMDWDKRQGHLKSDRVYKYTRSRIKWHLDNNHIVIFISGSPGFLVEKMAKKYNVTDCIGSNYLFENEMFNGTVIPMWDSRSKNTAIDSFVEKYDIDLNKSYAYGDTNGDINMLRRVGNPIAINPTKELLSHIASDPVISKTSQIIVERKDIIYSLSPNVDILDI